MIWYLSYRSEETVELVQSELLCALQMVEIPLFTTCPLFKKRLMDTLQNLIRRWESF